MENIENLSVPDTGVVNEVGPVVTNPAILINNKYRVKSVCWCVHNTLLQMKYEFDMFMAQEATKEFARRAGVEDMGNLLRNIRFMLDKMLKSGELKRVKRGRWAPNL